MRFAQISGIIKKVKLTCPKIYPSNTMHSDIRKIFQVSVFAVQPNELIKKSVHVENSLVCIEGKQFLVGENVYIVGFGKAVLGMALELENLLQNHIKTGILSVPSGLKNHYLINQERFLSKIKLMEGAKNNIPDFDSELAAHKISELVSSLGSSDILFVLISGGGSALLSYPKPPLTLDEKKQVIKILATKGATINELNTIRKKLSVLKGGGLAELAKPAQVISLILSDIIGDPLGLIASGPTVANTDDYSLPMKIVEKYKIDQELPANAKALLADKTQPKYEDTGHVHNFIIGNNSIALQAAAKKAEELFYKPIILTIELSGTASIVGRRIIQLIVAILQQDTSTVEDICTELNIDKEIINTVLLESKEIPQNFKGLCFLFGAETTVEVRGTGTGGRNQELALAASLELYEQKPENEIVLLSAGTDGIDGPTDAAGALATSSVVEDANRTNLNPRSFLENNDSYNFFKLLSEGLYHIKIGHTGTNVMDIIIVLVKLNK